MAGFQTCGQIFGQSGGNDFGSCCLDIVFSTDKFNRVIFPIVDDEAGTRVAIARLTDTADIDEIAALWFQADGAAAAIDDLCAGIACEAEEGFV